MTDKKLGFFDTIFLFGTITVYGSNGSNCSVPNYPQFPIPIVPPMRSKAADSSDGKLFAYGNYLTFKKNFRPLKQWLNLVES